MRFILCFIGVLTLVGCTRDVERVLPAPSSAQGLPVVEKAKAPQDKNTARKSVVFIEPREGKKDFTFPEALPLIQKTTHYKPYKVDPGDELVINIFGEETLSGLYQVAPDGTVALPLIGQVHVDDLTLPEAEDMLYIQFTSGFLIDPKISIGLRR